MKYKYDIYNPGLASQLYGLNPLTKSSPEWGIFPTQFHTVDTRVPETTNPFGRYLNTVSGYQDATDAINQYNSSVGSASKASNILSGITGIADLGVNVAADIVDGIKPIDDSASLEQLQAFGNQSLKAGSTTDVLNLYSPLASLPKDRDRYDYGYLDDGKALGSIGKSMLRGASSGAAFGNSILPGIGTAIGAIGGAFAGWGSGLFKTQKNNNQAIAAAEEYNDTLNEARQDYLNNIALANTNMQQRNLRNQLATVFADGGKIYIKPENKGKFTAAAKARGMGVQEFASKVLANKEDYSPLMVKRANFARNASRWNAFGGPLDNTFTNGVTMIGNGGTHEDNINGGVQMGIAPDGLPNMVEEGEAVYNDYVFSNRLKVPKAVRQKYKLRGETFADAFKQAQKESEERPNDPISKNGLDNIAMILAQSQEEIRQRKEDKQFACGGAMHRAANGNLLRYLEPIGSVIGLGYNLFDPYRPAEVSVGNAPMIASQAIGDYIVPETFDRNYWYNQFLANTADSRRKLSNMASPSAASNILAADYSAGLQAGQMARAGQEYNREQALKTAEFNRGTNQLNAQLALQAARANQAMLADYDKMRLNADQFNIQTKDTWKRGFDQAIAGDSHNIFGSLGLMGREVKDRETLIELAKAGALPGITEAVAKRLVGANGGKLSKTKKRGLTY